MRKIVNKYFRGDTTHNEKKQLIEWFEQSEQNKSSFIDEREQWNISSMRTQEPAKALSYNRLSNKLAYAASILLIVSLSLTLVFHQWKNDDRMQTIIVPAGQRVNLVLEDNTSVWLNSNTTFTFPVKFGKNKREVTLIGEGFFDVMNSNNKPFIVHTEKYQVEVLGTSFNVSAYEGFTFQTVLFEGSVNIVDKNNNSNTLLKAGELAVEDKQTLTKLQGVDREDFRWQSGIMTFNDEPIKNVISKLSAYYNQNIWIDSDFHNQYHCTAKFRYNDGLEYILKILQRDLKLTIVNDYTNNTIRLQ
jgi:transmembrane sensor